MLLWPYIDAVIRKLDCLGEKVLFEQVRRKADPAKGLVKDWVSNWRDNRSVRGSVSHDQLSGTKH